MRRFRRWRYPAAVALLGGVFYGGWWAARSVGARPFDGVGASTASAIIAPADIAGQTSVSLRREVLRLRHELDAEREGRESRELEWLEFTRAMASLDVDEAPVSPSFLELDDPEPSVEADIDPDRATEPDPSLARAAVILRELRALLLGEQILALDVLEVGRVSAGATGPVVVRLLDDRGRPAGTLACERLRLECSRAARSVTLVFEEGYERYGDQVLRFGAPASEDAATSDLDADRTHADRTGIRRIDLPHVDPQPWIERLPELFAAEDIAPVPDDGRWDRTLVLEELNRLLGNAARGGRWRLRELGGVVEDTLREVHLVQLDGDDRVIQRIFADELRIQAEGSGILLLLGGGVTEREGRRAPFLDGRYRIFLPATSMSDWRSSDLPHGLGPAGEPVADERG